MEYYKQFRTHLENNNMPSFINLWQEYCLSDEIELKELIKILESAKESTQVNTFSPYVEEILPIWETTPEGELKHEAFKLVFDVQTTNEPTMADLAYNYLEKRYGDDKYFTQKIRLVGLRDRDDFQYCISNFDLLNHMAVGNCFLHNRGWGCGEVMEISLLREQLTLEFDYVAGAKELSFANAFKTLIPLESDHFLSQRFCNADELEKKAKATPVAVMRMLLKDLGPKTAAEIKEELCDLVIPEEEWAKWWQTARNKMKRDTLIDMPKQLRDPFVLRDSEISHEERLQAALSRKPSVGTLIEMVYSFLRDFPAALKNAEFKASLKKQLEDILTNEQLTSAQEVQILFFLNDLSNGEVLPKIRDIIAHFNDIPSIVLDIGILAFKKRFLVEVRGVREDWDEIFLHLFLTVEHNPLREYLMTELLEEGKKAAIEAKLVELMNDPTYCPSAFLWYFQKLMTNPKLPFATSEGKVQFLEGFFVLLHRIERDQEMRDFVKKMHHFLTEGRYIHVRNIYEKASKAAVQEILLLSTKCISLSDHDISILHSLAEVVHPSLGAVRSKSYEEEEEEEIIWSTEEGFQALRDKVEHIGSVEVVQNSKEIEAARAHGDLRENSEFKYACEKRDRLQSELAMLSAQLQNMRVLTDSDIDTNEIGVGVIVTLENENGDSLRYTLLGPMEADPENNVISFQSKLAKTLTGLKIGDSCQLQEKSWKVVKIESYLEAVRK